MIMLSPERPLSESLTLGAVLGTPTLTLWIAKQIHIHYFICDSIQSYKESVMNIVLSPFYR